jgi:hypothetical protein
VWNSGLRFCIAAVCRPIYPKVFDWNSRRISNNIYIELLSEQGLIGFLAILLLIYRIIAPIFRRMHSFGLAAAGFYFIKLDGFSYLHGLLPLDRVCSSLRLRAGGGSFDFKIFPCH